MRCLLLFSMLVLVAALGLGTAGTSVPTRKVTLEQFAKIEAFKGQVVIIERIPWPKGYVAKSVSGPHYRITVQKKDHSRMVIERVQTQLARGERLLQHLAIDEATYPTDLLKDLD